MLCEETDCQQVDLSHVSNPQHYAEIIKELTINEEQKL
jgi:hypothetical protein